MEAITNLYPHFPRKGIISQLWETTALEEIILYYGELFH